ncbi:MAG TPA: SDR family oxidoreductase [Terrimicrobiaceae bacterium]|nr:SDR family oxidoreductase [Terrimicrobiaceae bacterium]
MRRENLSSKRAYITAAAASCHRSLCCYRASLARRAPCCHRCSPRRKGKIVVVGSATGLRGQPRRAAYSAARAAQHGYLRSVGAEFAAFGVNVIATGQTFVENPTYFRPSYQATEDFKQRMQGVPAGRLSTGREAAMFLLALAGPKSDWIFGQVFPYAGGWVT